MVRELIFVPRRTLRFVSRANPKDAQRHIVVGVQSFKPKEFAQSMNISLNNGWGIVRMIVDMVNKQPDGRYVLVKDPNNVSLATCRVILLTGMLMREESRTSPLSAYTLYLPMHSTLLRRKVRKRKRRRLRSRLRACGGWMMEDCLTGSC